jgi:branched-chain amino acid aminotransferase
MLATMDIAINRIERSKLGDLNLENLPFGKFFTDHMLEADYEGGEWRNIEIKPYQPLLLSPSVAALHYGQAIFEGIKAYKDEEGNSYIFRPQDNFKRFNISAERMEMPCVTRRNFYGRHETVGKYRSCLDSTKRKSLIIHSSVYVFF